MVNLYKVNIDWYDDCSGEEHDDVCLIFARDIVEAAERMKYNFKYINSIKMEEVCIDVQDGVLWLPFPMENLQEIIEVNTY